MSSHMNECVHVCTYINKDVYIQVCICGSVLGWVVPLCLSVHVGELCLSVCMSDLCLCAHMSCVFVSECV